MAKGEPGRAQARIHPAIPAAIAIVVCGLVLAAVARSGGDDGPEVVLPSSTTTTELTIPETTTSTTIPPDPVPVDELLAGGLEEETPASYRITYEVIENELARDEVWTVRRPYEAMVVSTRDGEITTATATSREALWTYLADKDGWLAIQPQLHRATFDLRPRAAIGPMIALGLAELVGEDEVAGRPCLVVRTGAPTGGAHPTPPSDEESTELCVDDAGLVLREVWQLDGTVLTERTAVGVEIDPTIPDGFFTPSPEVADAEEYQALLGRVAVIADEETVARLKTDVTLPAGFALDSTVLRAGTGQGATAASTEIVRFLTDGVDLVEHAEIFGDGSVELGGGAAVPVEIDGLDETWFVPSFRELSLRTRLTSSSYVELRGTDPALLFEMVRSLTRR